MKKTKIIILSALASACMFGAFAACGVSQPSNNPQIEIATTEISLLEGEKQAIVLSNLGKNDQVSYVSSNPDVATVSETGEITAVSVGDATITVTVGDKNFYCVVSVDAEMKAALTPYIQSNAIQDGAVRLTFDQSYQLGAFVQCGDAQLDSKTYSVEWKTEIGSPITVTPDPDDATKATVFCEQAGNAKIWIEVTYGSQTASSDVLDVTVDDVFKLTTNLPDDRIIAVTPKTVAGNTVTTGQSIDVEIQCTAMSTGTVTSIPAENVVWSVADEAVAKVNADGRVDAVDCGTTSVSAYCAEFDETLVLPVSVSVPIVTAYDLDALALITYYNDYDTAKELLSRNYLMMNDIDYSMHVRNFVLPIASPAGASVLWDEDTNKYFYNVDDGALTYPTNYAQNFSEGGNGSPNFNFGLAAHFSKTWMEILDLTPALNANGSAYMKKPDGSKFEGINPELVTFTGELNGNGYSIKNAWLMLDNYLASVSWIANAVQAASGACFIGLNYGTVANIAFENLTIGSDSDYFDYDKTTGGINAKIRYYYRDKPTGGNQVTASSFTPYYGNNVVKYSGLFAADLGFTGKYVLNNGNEWVTLHTGWSQYITNNNRYSQYSAVVFTNQGTIENVKLHYSNTAYTTYNGVNSKGYIGVHRQLADGLVYYNGANGVIRKAIVHRTDPVNPKDVNGNVVTYTTSPAAVFLCAYLNKGKIETVAATNQMASTAMKDENGNSIKFRKAMSISAATDNSVYYESYADIPESYYLTLKRYL